MQQLPKLPRLTRAGKIVVFAGLAIITLAPFTPMIVRAFSPKLEVVETAIPCGSSGIPNRYTVQVMVSRTVGDVTITQPGLQFEGIPHSVFLCVPGAAQ